jgi:polar amino acid transport system permease protein
MVEPKARRVAWTEERRRSDEGRRRIEGAPEASNDAAGEKILPRAHPGRWVAAAVALLLLAMVVHTIVTNPRFQWGIVNEYFTTRTVLDGLWLTLWMTAAVFTCGYVLGIGLAAARLSQNPVLRSLSFGYVWLIRSVPPLVQLLFWYELASLYPRLSFGVPFGPAFATVKTAHLFTGILAAFTALTLDVAAFAAEIVRGGILSVDRGQTEAAQSLGPASGNLVITMLKATSIVSVIAVPDLLYSVQLIYNQNFLVIPLLLVATLWYIIVCTVLSVGQYFVERHYARGSTRTFWRISRANLPLGWPAT